MSPNTETPAPIAPLSKLPDSEAACFAVKSTARSRMNPEVPENGYVVLFAGQPYAWATGLESSEPWLPGSFAVELNGPTRIYVAGAEAWRQVWP